MGEAFENLQVFVAIIFGDGLLSDGTEEDVQGVLGSLTALKDFHLGTCKEFFFNKFFF